MGGVHDEQGRGSWPASALVLSIKISPTSCLWLMRWAAALWIQHRGDAENPRARDVASRVRGATGTGRGDDFNAHQASVCLHDGTDQMDTYQWAATIQARALARGTASFRGPYARVCDRTMGLLPINHAIAGARGLANATSLFRECKIAGLRQSLTFVR